MKSHLPTSKIIEVVKREDRSIETFDHWKNCQDCQNRIKEKKKQNIIYNQTENDVTTEYSHIIYLDNFNPIQIHCSDRGVLSITTHMADQPTSHNVYAGEENKIFEFFRKVKKYINNLLSGKKTLFKKIDPSLIETDFQKETLFWTSLIPFGCTTNYGKIADWMGHNSSQAIGQALKNNPLPLIIPCHRVVRKDGSATDYALGKDFKQKLLAKEPRNQKSTAKVIA